MKMEANCDDFSQKHQKDLERIRRLRLLDDTLMTKVFDNLPCTELVLQIILDKPDLSVSHVICQYDIKNLQGRSARLDVLATDTLGKLYNIEIQRNDYGADIKRARYNSALIDGMVTAPQEPYHTLPETYIIFITEHDVLGSNLPIYHINRTIQETGQPFKDGTHIIYVNAEIKNETLLGQLMHDFSCTNAQDMHFDTLARQVRYFKEDQKGVEIMCKEMEELREETKRETLLDSIKNLMSTANVSAEKAMDMLKINSAERGFYMENLNK